MPRPQLKRPFFWLLITLLTLLVIELGLSEVFFQSTSKWIVYEDPLGQYSVRKQPRHFAVLLCWDVAKALIYRRLAPSAAIMQHDQILGYSHIPDSHGRHWAQDFDVTYSIGNDQERCTPTPPKPVGRLLFLGDSFTFGHGVNDDEAYPYLGGQHWPNWKVVNKAVMGWSTCHAYMVLSRELQRPEPPALVIYAMIPSDITRNYIRRSWVELLTKDNPLQPMQPHFEIDDGKLVYHGLVNAAQSKKDDPEMLEKEIELTRAFLVEMEHMCTMQQIPFVVLLLKGAPPYSILASLFEKDVPVIDLSRMKIEAFENDEHPNRNDHKRIADAIEKSVVERLLESLPKQ
jgi:hypothetical protein